MKPMEEQNVIIVIFIVITIIYHLIISYKLFYNVIFLITAAPMVDFSILVLTAGAWPLTQASTTEFQLPTEVKLLLLSVIIIIFGFNKSVY